MQDLDDGVQVGRGRLSAVAGDAGKKANPFVDDIAVVRSHRLLDVASTLSDGAGLIQARLRHLDPDERDAILDLITDQLNGIVSVWAELVRDAEPDGEVVAGPELVAEPEGQPETHRLSRTQAHPSAQTQTQTQTRTETGIGADPTVGAGPDPGPGVRLLPRRKEDAPPILTGAPDPPSAPAPLRSLKMDEPDGDHESDRLTRDELTGVLNRQAGFAALGRDLDRCRRAGERFVIGYLDVDGLKEINKTGGPRAGDELLRKVTAALRATLRSYDVIMRLGGDEFLFSLPGADMATAELRANEFGVILSEESPVGSASIGFGELLGNDTLDEIISRAENELANRRSRGRGR
jgi:diguanylate cyclase (GGDEF)-like protein